MREAQGSNFSLVFKYNPLTYHDLAFRWRFPFSVLFHVSCLLHDNRERHLG